MRKQIRPFVVIIALFPAVVALGQNTFTLSTINVSGGSGTANNIFFDYSVGEPYVDFGGSSCDSLFSGFQHVSVDTLRIRKFTIVSSGPLTFCSNAPSTLSAPSASTYLWSNQATSQQITPTVSGVYTSTVVTACGHTLTSKPVTILVKTPSTPSICLVTVDSLGQNNEIFWEKDLYPDADTFIVLRESNSLLYTPIARISKNQFSGYVDTNRHLGPFNGNPNFSYYKYKLQLRDTCGNLSQMSPYHQSIFIQDQQNGNFNWNYYVIENIGSIQTAAYILWRQDVLTGVSTTVGATSGVSASDSQYNTLSQSGNVKWFVSTTGFDCDPTAKAAKVSRTKSNNTNERQFPSGVRSRSISGQTSIYPNPSNQVLFIKDLPLGPVKIILTDLVGRELLSVEHDKSDFILPVSSLAIGTYLLKIVSGGRATSIHKVTIQH